MTLWDITEHYHITPQFPPAAAFCAANMPKSVQKEDLKGRLDLSDLLCFTIDGEDAKDFDDAVSLSKNEKGNYILGVHIADVSHYVEKNSPIDNAAFLRGTSVYLCGAVIPMLPFELSDGLCSLRPEEVRLTLSVFMEIGPRGKMKGYEICESYIKSKRRLTYKEAAEVLKKNKEVCERVGKEVSDTLFLMDKLSKILKRKRKERGAIFFSSKEAKIILNEKGQSTGAEPYPVYPSNDIIEEFMLAANETVAKHMAEKKLPAVFRVHEEPNEEKPERLLSVLPFLGVYDALKEGRAPKDYQKILEEVRGDEKEDIVNYIVLRSMSKAEYSDINEGHFGLAAKYYLHFTSPIRRYPDLLVHRVLKASIHKKDTEEFIGDCAAAATASTGAEINAADAEAEWKKIKIAEFMAENTGKIFEGNISHVTAKGFFVELSNTAEGFVSAATLSDDVYILSENKLFLQGVTNKKRYTIGDKVKIKVDFADSETGKLDFILYKKVSRKKAAAKKTKSKQARRAMKELRSESREARRQKEEKLFKTEYETQRAWQAAEAKVLSPLSAELKLKKGDRRFVRVSFEDYWHIAVKTMVKNICYSEKEQSGEKYIKSAVFGFERLLSTLKSSLGAELSENTEKKLIGSAEKILKKLERGLLNSAEEKKRGDGKNAE